MVLSRFWQRGVPDVIYRIVETHKENGLNPFTYLCHLFERLPNIDLADPYVIHEMLAYSASLSTNYGIRQ